jgi:hypothetical protein
VLRETKDDEVVFVDDLLLRQVHRIFCAVAGVVVGGVIERLLRDDEVLTCRGRAPKHIRRRQDSHGNSRHAGGRIARLETVYGLRSPVRPKVGSNSIRNLLRRNARGLSDK